MTGPEVRRPALRYYGGQWRTARWIIGHMPSHRGYLEPCAGGFSVFLRKRPATVETLNDLNGRTVNFMRQLRDNSEELIRRIDLTPWAEDEYLACREPADDPVEDARRLYVRAWQSVHGAGNVNSGWRWMIDPDGRRNGLSPAADWIRHDLLAIAQRLRQAQIRNRDALEVIERVVDRPEYLIYFDPPYLKGLRVRRDGYGAFEVSEQWHRDAAALLRSHAGHVLVSGYRSALYEELYERHGWRRVDRSFQGNSGSMRRESLWMNPRAAAAREAVELPLLRRGTA